MYYPYNGGFHYAPPPPSPADVEKQSLKKDGNYVGVTLLLLALAMQFTFTVVVYILMFFGIVSAENINHNYLGLDNTTYLLVYAVVYSLTMGVPAVLASVFCGRTRNPFTPRQPVSGGVVFLGLVGAIGLCMVANIVTTYLKMYMSEWGIPIPEFPSLMENTWISYGLNLFTIAVMPALLEEMVFRGYILQTLRRYGDGFAVLISAFWFGLMHGNVLQVPFAFLVGLVMSWLYVATDNIWIPILIHFCNNAISVTMEFITMNMADSAVGVFYSLCIYGLAFVGLVAVVSLLVFCRRRLQLKNGNQILSFGQRIGTITKSPVYIVAVIVYVFMLVKELFDHG